MYFTIFIRQNGLLGDDTGESMRAEIFLKLYALHFLIHTLRVKPRGAGLLQWGSAWLQKDSESSTCREK